MEDARANIPSKKKKKSPAHAWERGGKRTRQEGDKIRGEGAPLPITCDAPRAVFRAAAAAPSLRSSAWPLAVSAAASTMCGCQLFDPSGYWPPLASPPPPPPHPVRWPAPAWGVLPHCVVALPTCGAKLTVGGAASAASSGATSSLPASSPPSPPPARVAMSAASFVWRRASRVGTKVREGAPIGGSEVRELRIQAWTLGREIQMSRNFDGKINKTSSPISPFSPLVSQANGKINKSAPLQNKAEKEGGGGGGARGPK